MNVHSMARRLSAIAAALMFVVTVGAARADSPRPTFFVVDPSFTALPGATAHFGVHKKAGFRIEIPDIWNGKLVMYAHGFRGNGPALTVSNPAIREYLIANGYAWAASSYSQNRYNVKVGVKDTHALAKLFKERFGKPSRVYITGHSMGGHITGVSIEKHPEFYDGAVPMCGVMGSEALFDYFLSFNLVAQAVTGIDATFPSPPNYLSTVPGMLAALSGPAPSPFLPPVYPLGLSTSGEKLKGVTMNLSGGDRPGFEQGWRFWNLIPATPLNVPFLFQFGHDNSAIDGLGNPGQNEDTVYQIDSFSAISPAEAALNELVLRVEPRDGDDGDDDDDGEDGVKRAKRTIKVPAITGDIRVPVVSIHTLGDLFVPFSMEQIYAERVAAQGNADLLKSRAIRDINHCGFNVAEESRAFADMVNWVEEEVVPQGDDILDPAIVAADNFGCTYTVGGARGALPTPFLPLAPFLTIPPCL